MNSIRDHLGIHANALTLREKRNDLLASNIANAATPNYKARDIDFAAELQKASASGPMQTSNARHFVSSAGVARDTLYRDPVNPSLDGNTVELAVEQMQFSENTLRYHASLQFLNRKISGLMSAMRGE
jgi:flagellar basal-body rod protein FlgB